MTGGYKRTEIYSKPGTSQPKYMFVWLCDKLEAEKQNPDSILDVGAASGDFLRYAVDRFPRARSMGIEFDPELVALGQVQSDIFELTTGDANHMREVASASFDAVFMTGTHSIFDDFRSSFSECLRVARDGARILITGLFNDFPLDARIHWRYPGQFEANWHPGYNLFSKQSIGIFLDQRQDIDSYSFEKFVLPFDLAPQEDPVRSWTISGSDDKLMLRNGIMPLNMELLVIRKKVADQ